MNDKRQSFGPAHFVRLYDACEDPWHFRSSAYERAKYRSTIKALANRSFRSAFEVGCSVGELTRLLARRCEAMLAVDIIDQPLRTARARCADQPWVRFARMWVPQQWPEGTFDLIVLSEVLYFLSPQDVEAVADRSASSLARDGIVLLVNWTGRTGDPQADSAAGAPGNSRRDPTVDPCTGEEAADLFIDRTRGWLEPRTHVRETGYRLDLLVRPRGSRDYVPGCEFETNRRKR